MSDDNLDDFFAKKDKSKKKKKTTKPKSSSLEGKSKKPSEKKKTKDADKSEAKSHTAEDVIKDDDEWNDYKSNDVDISGLRIQNLHTGKEDEDECEENGENEAATGSDVKSEQSVWKTSQTTTSNKGSDDDDDMLPIPEPAPKPAAVPAHKEPPSEPKKYIPPGMRQAMNQPKTTITSVNMANRRKGGKTAPNLQSEFDFPTLEGATHPELEKQERDKHEYEVVRGSGGARQVESHKPAHIQLGNQFDVLGR